jgi:hypothetical protein
MPVRTTFLIETRLCPTRRSASPVPHISEGSPANIILFPGGAERLMIEPVNRLTPDDEFDRRRAQILIKTSTLGH